MRVTQFWEFVDNEFGPAYGRVLVADLSLSGCAGMTAAEALADGMDTKDVWLALCVAAEVPKSRWHGLDKPRVVRR